MKTLKFFFRRLKKDSRLNLLNISSLAIGVAAAIILLGYVYQEYHYDSQLVNSNRIYHILMQTDENELIGWGSYAPLAEALKSDFPEIEDATRVSYYWGNLALTAGGNMFNEKKILFADPNFFSLFSFPLKKGNALNDFNSPDFIAISESAAKRYFPDKNPIGEQIKIGSGKIFTVRGVFNDFPTNSNFQGDVVLPLGKISELTQMGIEPGWDDPSETYTFILTDKISNQEKLSAKIENYLTSHVEENPEKLFLQPLKKIHTDMNSGWEFSSTVNKKYLFLLTIVAIVILMMTAINFLMMYIGTTSQRQLNIGVKKVCGASKLSIFRDQAKETFLYVSTSILISVILVVLYNFTFAEWFTFLPSVSNFDFRLALLLTGLIILFVICASFSPALIISATKSIHLFKSNQNVNFKKIPIVKSLIVIQFTVSIVLLAVTVLFFKQMNFLEKYNPGFAREELVTIPLNMHIGEGFFNENLDVFCQELKKQSGVKNVTLAFSSPADVQTSSDGFRCDGMPEGKTVNMQWNSVYYDYFETLGVKLIDGRTFSRDFPGDMIDYDKGGKCAFLINQKAADEMGIPDPIGKTFHGYQEGIIIGIVEDFNFKSLHSEIAPMSFDINPFYFNEIIVRMNPGVPDVFDQIKTVWRQFAPDYPVEFSFVDEQLNKLYESELRLTANLNLFSGIAILIACMGLLSLTILAMQNRTKEIGIRKVNGAKVSEILAMLNRDFIKWVIIAFILATPISYFFMLKWLGNFAYKTNLSWWIFALAGIFSLGIALLTVSFQSWKAATKNPIESLRYE
ncbi:MAG: ABC transporter permease [Prolixibacteraceae bacterium]|nr:ABC transporter permease [Prolixibacteraceae bacterium]MBN2774887.1 ABC transporter permease [Prolixibacteraceae bacterium]